MENLTGSCDPEDTDWEQAPLITLMDAAKAGITNAQKELDKRQTEMARAFAELAGAKTDTVTPKES